MSTTPPLDGRDLPTAAQPVAAGEPPVVDVRVLKEMVGAEPEIVRDFLRQYLVSARALMADLRDGHAAGDLGAVAAATHKLKSSSRAVGAHTLGERCARTEAAAQQREAPEVAALTPQLEHDFAAVEDSIAGLLGAA
jgi:HPt (histidine-containing phosphotransfer) domain-containing protein